MKTVLAIETTQRTGGVALIAPDGRTHVERFAPARRHDDRLLPAIDALCDGAGVSPAALDGVCVSTGPGSFSGVRIGIATARLIALPHGRPVVGVPSAEVIAAGTPGLPETGRIVVALACKRSRAWLTVLERAAADDPWQITGRPTSGEADDVPWADVAAVVADEHLPAAMRNAAERHGHPIVAPVLDPAACLVIGRARLASGQDDAATLTAIYPGPPEAVVLWNERHGVT